MGLAGILASPGAAKAGTLNGMLYFPVRLLCLTWLFLD